MKCHAALNALPPKVVVSLVVREGKTRNLFFYNGSSDTTVG